jgi:coenzyme F420-reducing hydrogenase beta subunit
MIKIENKEDCCGCYACLNVCSKDCITMERDNEGFFYPKVDESLCIDCHLCENVCPKQEETSTKTSLHSFAARYNEDNARKTSSSGAMFPLLANKILENKGVIFASMFDRNWNVVVSYFENKEEITPFLKSKYVQSHIGYSFREVKSFLKEGRQVMFVGTPCQVEGLNNYLKDNKENLITVELICHGVPSEKVWQMYLEEVLKKNNIKRQEVKNIEFRSKRKGWLWYSLEMKNKKKTFFTQTKYDNIFLRGFLQNYFLRPSCYNCPSKALTSGSDFTIGDFWSMDKVLKGYDDDKGTSILLVNSKKAEEFIKDLNFEKKELPYQDVVMCNKTIITSSTRNENREVFFRDIDKGNIIDNINKYLKPTKKPTLSNRIKRNIRDLLFRK